MSKSRKVRNGKRINSSTESDSSYILKIVFYLILGAIWFRFIPQDRVQIPLPVGAFVGLYFASHDRFAIDRKIEYGILVIAMFVGFWLPIGISIDL